MEKFSKYWSKRKTPIWKKGSSMMINVMTDCEKKSKIIKKIKKKSSMMINVMTDFFFDTQSMYSTPIWKKG